jgi:hypothetical protein
MRSVLVPLLLGTLLPKLREVFVLRLDGRFDNELIHLHGLRSSYLADLSSHTIGILGLS